MAVIRPPHSAQSMSRSAVLEKMLPVITSIGSTTAMFVRLTRRTAFQMPERCRYDEIP